MYITPSTAPTPAERLIAKKMDEAVGDEEYSYAEAIERTAFLLGISQARVEHAYLAVKHV